MSTDNEDEGIRESKVKVERKRIWPIRSARYTEQVIATITDHSDMVEIVPQVVNFARGSIELEVESIVVCWSRCDAGLRLDLPWSKAASASSDRPSILHYKPSYRLKRNQDGEAATVQQSSHQLGGYYVPKPPWLKDQIREAEAWAGYPIDESSSQSSSSSSKSISSPSSSLASHSTEQYGESKRSGPQEELVDIPMDVSGEQEVEGDDPNLDTHDYESSYPSSRVPGSIPKTGGSGLGRVHPPGSIKPIQTAPRYRLERAICWLRMFVITKEEMQRSRGVHAPWIDLELGVVEKGHQFKYSESRVFTGLTFDKCQLSTRCYKEFLFPYYRLKGQIAALGSPAKRFTHFKRIIGATLAHHAVMIPHHDDADIAL